MAEDRYLLYKNYNFRVEVNGVPLSFSRVSGMERSVSVEELQEGGFNRHVHYLNNGLSGERTLTLEYGMAKSNTAVSQLTPGRMLLKGVTVMVLGDDSSKPVVTYSFDGCYIKKINFGDLNAASGELLISNLEIVYSYMTEVK